MTRNPTKLVALALAAMTIFGNVNAQDSPKDDGGEPLDPDQCRPMQQIYKNGKQLCETIFGSAFRYVPVGAPDYDLAYTMWYFSSSNPNDATTQARIAQGLHPDPDYQSTDVCW